MHFHFCFIVVRRDSEHHCEVRPESQFSVRRLASIREKKWLSRDKWRKRSRGSGKLQLSTSLRLLSRTSIPGSPARIAGSLGGLTQSSPKIREPSACQNPCESCQIPADEKEVHAPSIRE